MHPIQAEPIFILLSEAGMCASGGSVGSSGSLGPWHVLKTIGVEERIAGLRCAAKDEESRKTRIPGNLRPLCRLDAATTYSRARRFLAADNLIRE